MATELEITEVADREMKSPGGGKALLFERPTIDGRPSRFPLAINTMGSHRRMALALGVPSVDDLAHQMQLLLKAKPPTNVREGWSLLKQGVDLLHARPKRVKGGPCKEVVTRSRRHARRRTLARRPADPQVLAAGRRPLRHAAERLHARSRTPGERNLGMYRMQVYDGRTTGMHWQVHKVGARHGKRYYERGERMPVAVCLGGDPAYTFAATAPLPDGLDEILFAGFARKKSVELVRCETVDLEVPADVDFVLEGYVQPGEARPEGPFGDHTGFLHAGRRLPGVSPDGHHAPQGRGLPRDHRRRSADGGLLHGRRQRAGVPAGLPKMNFPEIVDL